MGVDVLDGILRGYEDGEIIFSQGDAAADMYVIRSGQVRIFRTNGDTEVTLTTLGQDEFFGEIAVFSPGPRTATAEAVGPTECEILDKSAFLALVKDPVVWDILARMSERIRLASERIDGISGSGG